MTSLTFLFLLIGIVITNSEIVIKSERLTPKSSNLNGVNILTHIEEVTKINNDEQWHISTVYQHTWQFIIILDKTWGFSPDEKSSITFTVNSPTIPASQYDIIFGFATYDNEYISMAIPMGTSSINHPWSINTNKIYPNCFTNDIKSDFAVGDISTLPDYDRVCDIANGNCNNWKNMQPENTEIMNTFPITVEFVNDPNTKTLELSLHSTTIQTCKFGNLPANEIFKIYFGGNENGDTFDITSFDIKYSVFDPNQPNKPNPNQANPANLPQFVPTNISNIPKPIVTQPQTTKPTNKPTFNPTVRPTQQPSFSPTARPSFNPVSVEPVQWTNIYYDNMQVTNGWVTRNQVTFGDPSSRCPISSSDCVRINGCANSRGGDSYIEKTIDITGYNSIRLKFDVALSGIESGDSCEIWYAFGSDTETKIVALTTDSVLHNNVLNLPYATDNALKIKLNAHGSSRNRPCSDRCYWDNLYVEGMLINGI